MKVQMDIEGVEKGLVVNPGDTMVFTLDGSVTDSYADEAMQRLRDLLPGVRVVVVTNVSGIARIPGGENAV